MDNSTQQLRQQILTLAIQGKLVPQIENEDSAEDLLNKIETERKKSNPKFKPAPRITKQGDKWLEDTEDITKEIPFDIPESWNWVRLNLICWLENGEKSLGEKLPNMEAKYLRGKIPANILQSGVIVAPPQKIILVDGENSGEIFNVPERGYLGSTFKILLMENLVCEDYIQMLLLRYKEMFRNNKKGAAIPHLNKEIFRNLLVGLPPLSEQKRIVEKLDVLLKELDNIEQSKEQIEHYAEQLQNQILQEAISGRLVPQIESEGTAEDLLNKIETERKKSNPKFKPAPRITKQGDQWFEGDEDITGKIPFEIPEDWKWVRLGNITQIPITDGTHQTPTYTTQDNGIPFISSKDVTKKYIDWSHIKYITKDLHKELYKRIAPKRNDILLAKNGTTGVAALVDTDIIFDIYVTLAVIRPFLFATYPLFLLNVINSPLCKEQFNDSLKGEGVPNLHLNEIVKTLIPLPPLSEQKRIVEKLEEVLGEIEKLKK